MEPTNADLKKVFDAHTSDDREFQKETRAFNGEMAEFKAEVEGSLAAIHEKLGQINTKDEEAEMMGNVIRQFLLSNGKTAFHGIVALSILIGAIVVILGGAKSILIWLGFAYIK